MVGMINGTWELQIIVTTTVDVISYQHQLIFNFHSSSLRYSFEVQIECYTKQCTDTEIVFPEKNHGAVGIDGYNCVVILSMPAVFWMWIMEPR